MKVGRNPYKFLKSRYIVLIFSFLCMSITFTSCDSKSVFRKPIEKIQINDHVWLLNDNNESTGYLVVGTEKAAIIDTMNGYEDVNALARTITNLPIIVFNTHGHSDHIYGDAYFDECYIHPDDRSLAEENFSYANYRALASIQGFNKVKFKSMNAGDLFDLGGITLEIYLVPGHTLGGVCILDREDRVLFTGDTINRHCWMQLPCSTSMDSFFVSLKELEGIKGEYDFILHGHATKPEDACLYEEHMAAVKEVADGISENDTTYEYWGGTCMQHPFPKGEGVIVY